MAKEMDLFFTSLILICAGGLLPLLISGSFKAMKVVAIILIGGGSLLGAINTFDLLLHSQQTVFASLPFLGSLSLSFRIDSLAAFFLIPIFVIIPIVALYSYDYMDKRGLSLRTAGNYFFFAVLTVSMALVACADNIITFALAWELMSLSSFFLVIYDFEKRPVRRAGYLYFGFAQAGAMAIFFSFALIYSHTGSMDFTSFTSVPASAKALIFTLAFIGFGSKAGMMPLHVGEISSVQNAPSHVSALMSGVMIKMGIYGIIRMYSLLHPQGLYCAELVISVGAITGVFGVVYALGQSNLKRLLAYSSVENIGIILLGIGIGMLGVATGNMPMAALGFAGGLLHVLNHAIFKSLLFMGAGAVQHHTGTLNIEQLGGLMKRIRLCGVTFFIGALSICALPPFNGFISEFLLYNGAFHGVQSQQVPFLFIMLAILSLAIIGGLAIACFTQVIGIAFLGEPRSKAATTGHPVGSAIQAAMVILAALCTIIGLAPQTIIPLVMRVTASLLPQQIMPPTISIPTIASQLSFGAITFSIIVLVIIGIRRIFNNGPAPRSGTWGCGFTQPSCRMQYTASSFAATFLDLYKPFVLVHEKFSGLHGLFPRSASYHNKTHDVSEIGLQRCIVRPVTRITAKLRWLQHGHIQLYIGYIFFAVCGLLFWLVL